MAHANPYAPGQVETLEQARNELVKLADTVKQIIDNQKLVQRDDGCLLDCVVVPHTLSDEVVHMIGHFELVGAYAARPYQKGQVVTYQERMYVCAAAHHGGAVMDMAQWRLLGKACFNDLQQLTDTKLLWLKQNAILPYDSDTDYPVGTVTLKDGKFQKWDGAEWADFIEPEDSQITTWSGRTQEEKNRDTKSIFDYRLPSDTSYSDTLTRALAQGARVIYFPHGTYNFTTAVDINVEGVVLYGFGKLLFDGTGGAGSNCFYISEGDFSASGLSLECSLTAQRAFFRFNNVSKDISGFVFHDLKFKNGFYSTRGGIVPAGGLDVPKVKNILISHCQSDARTDVNCGHFLISSFENVQMIGNRTSGGKNTSVYGLNFGTGFVVANNIEKGVITSVVNAEASCQIEDCEYGNGVIVGNTFSHDIWVSGASGVLIDNNRCAQLRVSVGNPTGHDVHSTIFKENYCISINAQKYGSLETANTYSFECVNNTIDPQYALKLGRPIPSRAHTIQGGDYGKDITLRENKVISASLKEQASLIRGSILNYKSYDNDWGVGSVVTSGTGGYAIEHNVLNPILGYAADMPNHDLVMKLSADFTVAGGGVWSKFNNTRVDHDLNLEIATPTSTINFKKVGLYQLSYGFAYTAPIGATVGLRVLRGTAEIERLIFEKATGDLTFKSGVADIRVSTAAKDINLEVFCSVGGMVISSISTLTKFGFKYLNTSQ